MSTQIQKQNIELTKMNASSEINLPKFFGLKQIAFDAAGVLDNPVYLSRDKKPDEGCKIWGYVESHNDLAIALENDTHTYEVVKADVARQSYFDFDGKYQQVRGLLLKVFGGDNIKKFVEFLVDDKDSPLESDLLTKSLENAQEKIELYNYDIRKNVFQYDDVLNFQRHFIYNIRKELLCNNIPSELITRFGEVFVDEIIASNRPTLQRWVVKCAASSLPEDTAEGARSAWSATAVSVGTRPSRMS